MNLVLESGFVVSNDGFIQSLKLKAKLRSADAKLTIEVPKAVNSEQGSHNLKKLGCKIERV